MKNGLFIVVDGMDGTGKTEIVKMLHNYLFSKKKYRILTTREPTSGKYGREIREMLRDENDPISSRELLLELFVKDRKEHLENTIIPFLKSSKDELHVVICDRYYYSTIAFQHAQGLPLNMILDKNKGFLKPDMAFILDAPPELSLERISGRQKEKFEQLEFMKKLRKNFLNLKNILKEDIIIIDSSKPLEEVFKEAAGYLERILKE